MLLKSIEIFGYKSFAQKTTLEFRSGITGIVGPNGSGKSNIIESIRWCLGEMSWKSLRAGSMTDVIFAGTAKRQPLSLAEVTLCFDNASNRLPVDYTEVMITRRLFKSGESAYFLNKTQCRLKDVRELFLDTGLGEEGYAIIDQGGVDFVLNSKPEERRALFEEASGVSRYKAKREEALRKLDRVEADMGRAQDALALISEQVRKLDNDARKAKLFEKYQAELKALEATLLCQEIGGLREAVAALTSEAEPLAQALEDERVRRDALDAEVQALDLRHAEILKTVTDLKADASLGATEFARLEERICHARENAAAAAASSERLRGEIAGMETRLAEMEPRMEAARLAAAGAKEALEKAREAARAEDEALAAAKSEGAGFEKAFDAAKQAVLLAAQKGLDARRLCDQERSKSAHVQAELASLSRDAAREEERIQTGEGELKELSASLEAGRESARTARVELDEARARLESLEREDRALAAAILEKTEEAAKAGARLEALDAEGRKNAYWSGAQACLAASIPGVVGLVRDLIAVPEGSRRLLEDLMGERLFAVACQNSQAASEAVSFLRVLGTGRARFLVLDAVPDVPTDRPLPESAAALLKAASCDPAHERAVRFLLADAFEISGALHAGPWVFGGAAPAAGAAETALADLPAMRESLKSVEGEIAAFRGRRESAAAEAVSARESLRTLEARSSEAMKGELALAARFKEKEDALMQSRQGIFLLREESAAKRSEIDALNAAIEKAAKDAETAAEEEARAKTAEESAARALSQFKESLKDRELRVRELRGQAVNVEYRVSVEEEAAQRLAREKESLSSQIEFARTEIERLSSQASEAERTAERAEAEKSAIGDRLGVLEKEIGELDAKSLETETALAAKRQELKALQDSVESRRAELSSKEVELSSRKAALETLEKRLVEESGMSYEDASSRQSDEAPSRERIEMLRKRVQSLGNVNLAAPEEYEALSSRQNFLSSQIEDLNKAKEDLKRAISQVNSSTRESFLKTYAEVREHFRRIYGVLFEGGEADLVLTMPDNPMETGVDIVAQPPGKRLQKLSLLSGGEKALTALALLFAFFMVRPAPFCLLDEADGALDDANVGRLVRMLREFASRTQFLVISHNKRTLEAADVIYGVTMAEMGVSRIVSVSLAKAQAIAQSVGQAPAAAAA
jgi:chromosome segregation protein